MTQLIPKCVATSSKNIFFLGTEQAAAELQRKKNSFSTYPMGKKSMAIIVLTGTDIHRCAVNQTG